MKLNLACGNKLEPGYLNVDIALEVNPDMVMDLTRFPWPWEDNSIEEISCSHFLEHLGDEVIPFLDECYRVLQDKGIARFLCPYYTSVRSWQDPTHKRAISEPFFLYFNRAWREKNGLWHYPINSNFELIEVRYIFAQDLHQLSREELSWLRDHSWNTVQDFETVLEARKSASLEPEMDKQAAAAAAIVLTDN